MKLKKIFNLVVPAAGLLLLGCGSDATDKVLSKGISVGKKGALSQRSVSSEQVRRQSLADTAMRSGDEARRSGDFKNAIILYRESVRQVDNPLLRVEIFKLLDDSGRDAEALAEIRSLLSDKKKSGTYQRDPSLLVRYASLCEQQKATAEAVNVYKSILASHHPKGGGVFPPLDTNIKDLKQMKATVKLIEAGRLQSRGQDKEAIACCLEALKIKPNFPMAHLMLGFSYEVTGDRLSARKEYAIAEQTGDAAVKKAAIASR